MSEYLATEAALIGAELQVGTGPPDAVYTVDVSISDTRILVPVFDTKVRASGGRLAMTSALATWVPVCPYSSATYNFTGGGGIINATSVKCRASGLVPLRENDSGTCMGSWVLKSGGTVVNCACTLSITDAGQDKAKGE